MREIKGTIIKIIDIYREEINKEITDKTLELTELFFFLSTINSIKSDEELRKYCVENLKDRVWGKVILNFLESEVKNDY